MNTIFLNGQFVSHTDAKVSVIDRGFLYGDGLFETLRVYDGRPAFWDKHWQRLQSGADFLRIRLPYASAELRQFVTRLLEANNAPDSVLRIHVSRGVGTRGYSIKGADRPVVAMTSHPVPGKNAFHDGLKLFTSSVRLPVADPLARFKTSNKLHQVVARTEAEEQGADDALLLNTDGLVAETTSCNVFFIERGAVITPPLEAGILPGITRAVVMEMCAKTGICCQERQIRPEDISRFDGMFLTSSVLEIIEVSALNGKTLPRSPISGQLLAAYRAAR